MPDHVRGGDWSRASQVNTPGISAFWANALDFSSMIFFPSAEYAVPHAMRSAAPHPASLCMKVGMKTPFVEVEI
jgi:hypothetical protein